MNTIRSHPSPMTVLLLGALAGIAALALGAPGARGGTLTIKSVPPGATVEIDGIPPGTTPFASDFPAGYFHKPHVVFQHRLERSLTARISKPGYVTKTIELTYGPLTWSSSKGRHRSDYWLFKSDHFEVTLEPAGAAAESAREDSGTKKNATLRTEHFAGPENPLQGFGTVSISSDPEGAEIYVDEKFVGNTPSTFKLAMGSHHISLQSAGKRTWERNLEVLKDSHENLHPALEAKP